MGFWKIIIEPKKSFGFKLGDVVMVPDSSRLYRYIGTRRNLPGTPYDRKVLAFDWLTPIFDDGRLGTYNYVVTPKSSSRGYIEPTDENSGGHEIIRAKPGDLDKLGNMSHTMWHMLRTSTLDHMKDIGFLLEGKKGTAYDLLQAYADKTAREKERICLKIN